MTISKKMINAQVMESNVACIQMPNLLVWNGYGGQVTACLHG